MIAARGSDVNASPLGLGIDLAQEIGTGKPHTKTIGLPPSTPLVGHAPTSPLSTPLVSLAENRWTEVKVNEDFKTSLWPALEALGWNQISYTSSQGTVQCVYGRPGVSVSEVRAEINSKPHGIRSSLF